MIDDLRGSAAVVTGAAAGIGLAVVERLCAEGVRVVASDIDAQRLALEVDRLRADGATVHAVVADVRDEAAVEHLAAAARELLGPVHLLVSNAGVVTMGASWELPLEEWRRVIDVDLWGAVHGVRSFVPGMIAAGEGGHVVTIGSMQSVIAVPGLAPYAVAKHGALALTDALRAELATTGSGVGASLVLPGRIRTDMNPEGAPASLVADAVVAAATRDLPFVATDPRRRAEVEQRGTALLAAFDVVLDAGDRDGSGPLG